MNAITPPRFLQSALQALVPARDRETIAGDLMEGYAERRHAGLTGTNLWYAQQVMSFFPSACARAFVRTPLLVLLCCFTMLCGLWLGTMDIVLRHRNLVQHEAIAGLIVGQGFATLVALPLRGLLLLRWSALLGALGVTYLGCSALWAAFHTADTEGYILLIASALIVQATLTGRALLVEPRLAA